MSVDILGFGAHPDDVELAAAGTLIRAVRGGASTGIITLTRGELGTRGTPITRAAEFDASSAMMGLACHEMLDLPDGSLEANRASRHAVLRKIREHRPRIVLLPYGEDRHPDHAATCTIVQEAAFLAGLRRIETGQEPHRPAELIYYMASWEFVPSFIVDISAFIEDKRRVLSAYGTQLHNPGAASADPTTFISSEHYLELWMARMAHYGHLIGKKYGEPFRVKGLLEVKDLLDSFGDRVY